MALWSGKDLVNNQKDSDRDAEPLQALKNWQYVYQLLEDNIVNSSTVFKIYLALRNALEPSPVKISVVDFTILNAIKRTYIWRKSGFNSDSYGEYGHMARLYGLGNTF